MKKITTAITVLIILAVLTIGFNITGFTVDDPETPEISVTRPPIVKSETENTTTVKLKIISSENIVSIKETFLPKDCEILSTYSEPEINVFEVDENDQTWVIANRSDTLNVDIYYFLTYECDINESAGEVFVLTNENILSSGTFDQEDTEDTDGTGERGGNNGGSTSDGQAGGIRSIPIQQTDSEKEFDEVVEEAVKNILGIDESKEVDTSSIIIWIVLAIIIIIILVVLVYLMFKKPKAFPKKQPKPRTTISSPPKRQTQNFQ